MKKSDFNRKIKQMMKDHNKAMITECDRLFNSGGIDTESAENDFRLPRTIFHVALLNEAHQYKPFSSEALKDVKNLIHF